MSSQASSPSASFEASQDADPVGEASSSPNSLSESLVFSQENSTLDNEGLDQNAESERHPKGKRKRTAAKDKAILEAAYIANPKPDKAARLDIVNRVSLNEKEVQIWFQNRRQNDRRKSRPLSPQEIAALRYGGMQILSDPLSYNLPNIPQGSSMSPEQGVAALPVAASMDTLPSPTFGSVSSDNVDTKPAMGGGDDGALPFKIPAVTEASETPTATRSDDGSRTLHRLSQSFSGPVGYLSNRRNASSSFSTPSSFSLRPDDSFRLEPFTPSSCPPATASSAVLPTPQTSQFRLSLSLEGKAEVVSSQPSPDRIAPARPSPSELSDVHVAGLRRPSLQRSHSAQSTITLPPISALTASLTSQSQPRPSPLFPPRLNTGRSRDVHAWEVCCDADRSHPHDELTAQAERESSGSAIAAISLLRSTSSTASSNVLQPNGSKRNAAAFKPWRSNPAHQAKRPKLGRSSSSVARLQTIHSKHNAAEKPAVRRLGPHAAAAAAAADDAEAPSEKKVKVSMLLSPSGNDSDKENWSPDEEGNPQARNIPRVMGGRRPLPSAAPKGQQQNPRRAMGRVLGEHRGPAFLGGSRANTAPISSSRRKDSGVEILEDDDDDVENGPGAGGPAGDEVELFMRGEISPSKKDCVAGLLSLSQGNWR